MNTDELYKYWETKVKNKRLYRAMSSEYLLNTTGIINPKNNPYKSIHGRLLDLFTLVLKLEKTGRIFKLKWTSSTPKLSRVLRITLNDFYEKSLDFSTSYEEVIQMVNRWKGGYLVNNIGEICSHLLTVESELPEEEKNLLKYLSGWVNKKLCFENKIISVNGDSPFLEKAKFQHLGRNLKEIYWPSPFGSFEHFTSISKDLNKYIPYLEGSKRAYIRVIQPIPLKNIQIITP